jgi:hypothetical protein
MKLFQSLLIGATLLALNAGASRAITLTVEGNDYDVTTFTGSYNSNTIKFNVPASSGVMPWWGNSNLAQAFATAALAKQTDFGLPNFNALGPLFAYDLVTSSPGIQSVLTWTYNTANSVSNGTTPGVGGNFKYAQATLLTPPTVPGPVPALGVLAALRLSRQLRRRVRLSA